MTCENSKDCARSELVDDLSRRVQGIPIMLQRVITSKLT